MSSGARNDVLISLLIELFEVDELRRFIEKLDDGPVLLAELPGSGASRITFACEVVRSLQRRGEIGLSLFAALEIERPKQQDLIRGVAVQVLVQPSRVSSSRPPINGHFHRSSAKFRAVQVVSAFLGLVIVICASLNFTGSAERAVGLRVEACKIRCEDCADMARAWITVDDGQTIVVEINGQEISFDCLTAGTKVSVVLQVRDGQTKMKFLYAEMVARGEPVEIPLADFSEGVPDGFVPETAVRQWDAAKKRTTSRRTNHVKTTVNVTPAEPSGAPNPILPEKGLPEKITEESDADATIVSSQRVVGEDRVAVTTKRKADINCESNRQRVNEAVELRHWKRIPSLTESVCWENDPRKIDLRSRAFFELGLFSECIALGEGSTDETIVRRARTCAKRLETKQEADERRRRIAGEDPPPTPEQPAL